MRALTAARYQRAYVDFFEDELVRHGYDWKEVVQNYLYSGRQPLVNSLVAGRMSLLTFYAPFCVNSTQSATHSSTLAMRSNCPVVKQPSKR